MVPGKCILHNRHIKVSPECPLCREGPEDIRHLLFTCARARKVWKSLGLIEVVDTALKSDQSGSVVMEEILRLPQRKSPVLGHLGLQETVAVAAWYIWWERREAVKGESTKQAASSAFSIQAITVNHAPKQNILILEKTWKKPQPGSYKLNIDACFFDDGAGAVAAILRNCRGEAIAGASETFDHAYNAQAAETLALWRGVPNDI